MSLQPRALSLQSFNSAGFPKLPPELTSHIIDNFHDDFYSLKCIALVCRSWVASARKHIFFSVMLVSDHIPTDGDSSIYEDIMKHLNSVRSLGIMAPEVPLDLDIVKSVGPVEELRMEMAGLEILDLESVFFAFPRLSRLVLKTSPGCGIFDVASDLPVVPLKKLEIAAPLPNPKHPQAPNLVLSMLLQHKLPLIEALTLDLVADRDLFALRDFLRTHEGNIKHLDLRFKYTADESTVSSLADVLRERCMDIKRVRIKSHNIGSRCLLQLVPAFKSSNIERAVIIIYPCAKWFSVLRSILSFFDGGFTAASSLVVYVPLDYCYPRDPYEIWRGDLWRLKAKWPALLARGILKIDLDEDHEYLYQI